MKFYEAFSETTRKDWPRIYKELAGKKWVEPVKDKRGITCEVKIEDTEEISKLMSKKPSYSIDEQGREG